MKSYRVEINFHGDQEVDAENEQDAINKVIEMLREEGGSNKTNLTLDEFDFNAI